MDICFDQSERAKSDVHLSGPYQKHKVDNLFPIWSSEDKNVNFRTIGQSFSWQFTLKLLFKIFGF